MEVEVEFNAFLASVVRSFPSCDGFDLFTRFGIPGVLGPCDAIYRPKKRTVIIIGIAELFCNPESAANIQWHISTTPM